MNIAQHLRAKELFEAVLEQEPPDVDRWLQDMAPEDPDVRAEVRSLLDYHSRAGRFLTQPLVEAAPHLLEEDRALEPGTVLGPYTIVRELGRGGMGRVYLASDARLGRSIALKSLPPQLTRDSTHRDRLRREARAAALLTHPGICTVYALEEFDGELYIATEYLEGQTLREEMSGARRPSIDLVVATARELAAALASAHVKGVTHRDLKPENIMRTHDGRIKILDFGLARIDGPAAVGVGTLTSVPGAVAGTPAYMSPEQVEGRTAGPSTDVFAFGVLVYEWLSGTHPFLAGSALATLARVVESKPEPLAGRAGVPAWLSDVVDRCLRKAPSDRYTSAVELAQALGRPSTSAAEISGSGSSTWWRTHQFTMMVLYILATTRGWQIKEAIRGVPTLWIFILMGVVASVAGIVRGHLLFTDHFNRRRLTTERRRTRQIVVVADVMLAALLIIDALLLATAQPLNAVLTICVAVGIALAAVLMEPATDTAVFGE